MEDVDDDDHRDPTAVVQQKIRMREPLRARLEVEAKARGVSINIEVVDRLERTFDRQDLLAEVLAIAYSKEMAGILLMLGSVMDDTGFMHLYSRPRRYSNPDHHWAEDPAAYEQAMLAGIAVLKAARPRLKGEPRRGKMTPNSENIVREKIRAVRQGAVRPFTRSASTRSLLGPIARRLTHERSVKRNSGGSSSVIPSQSPQISKSDSMAIADAVLNLVNSSPFTPSREEIAELVLSKAVALSSNGSKI